ncbi:MAG: hypothetical protein LBJ08_02795 [Bifidobacteriaceae bacterium]|jgi:hypothetical protein|nr:hypothetical protein [Bifidobacteriaceae bacterium]
MDSERDRARDEGLGRTVTSGGATLRERWRRWTEPREDGRPNRRVIAVFPLLVLAGLLVAVTLGLNGSSVGVVHRQLYGTTDPNLIAGHPLSIRSDEFNTQTVYTISQDQLGLPRYNNALPGGVDMSLNWEAPYTDWSIAFRPHQWGFFGLPLDNAFSLKWWLPFAELLIAAYFLIVAMLPRYPLVGAASAIAFGLSPFVQWWYTPQAVLPLAWGCAAMAGLQWFVFLRAWWSKALLAGGLVLISAQALMGHYAPFIIPTAFVVMAFAVGWVASGKGGRRARLRALVWIGGAGAAAGAIMVLFLTTRSDRIADILGTVYPGTRLTPPGAGKIFERPGLLPWTGLFSADALELPAQGVPLMGNDSESSAFVLTFLFLAPVAAWCLVALWRRKHKLDWNLAAALAVIVLVLAYWYLPGWDGLAHLLFLDRSPLSRSLPGPGLEALVMVPVVGRAIRELPGRKVGWALTIGTAVVFLGAQGLVMAKLQSLGIPVSAGSVSGALILVSAVALVALCRGHYTAAAAFALVVSLVLGATVNPLSRGLFDLRSTPLGQAVLAQAARSPGDWVGIGSTELVTGTLVETGVGGMNGVQGGPRQDRWRELDPEGLYEDQWNRMAYVMWTPGPSAERVFSPQPDVITVRFDACASFEQEHIVNVLVQGAIESPCLEPTDEVAVGNNGFNLYRVVASQ